MELDNTMSPTIGKLAEALSKAQGEFEHAKKAVDNAFFKSKYADLASVIDAAREPLAKNGLSVIQTTKTMDGKVTLVTMLSHSSGEWIRGEYPINPTKQDPQGYGSAFTYARRYCFSAITGIASDDDDGNAASQPAKKESLASRNKRYDALKAELLNSEDPAVTWGDYKDDIAAFRVEMGEEYYQQLVDVAKKRKDEIAKVEMMKDQLGENK